MNVAIDGRDREGRARGTCAGRYIGILTGHRTPVDLAVVMLQAAALVVAATMARTAVLQLESRCRD
jgi:hypothetical protein